MTLKFDDMISQIDSLDQDHFGESFSMRSDAEQGDPFTGVISDEPIFLDSVETLGYLLEVPLSQWVGRYPRKNRNVITRIKTGEEFTVHSARVKGTDLIINLVN